MSTSTTIDKAPTAADQGEDEWISAHVVSLISGLPEKKVALAAERGLLTVRRPPPGFGHPKYSRRSVEALVTRMITRAKASPASQEKPG